MDGLESYFAVIYDVDMKGEIGEGGWREGGKRRSGEGRVAFDDRFVVSGPRAKLFCALHSVLGFECACKGRLDSVTCRCVFYL